MQQKTIFQFSLSSFNRLKCADKTEIFSAMNGKRQGISIRKLVIFAIGAYRCIFSTHKNERELLEAQIGRSKREERKKINDYLLLRIFS